MSDHTEFNLTDLDLLTLEPLSTLPSDERIILDDGKRIEIVGREYLLGSRYSHNQVIIIC
jgi:hypothetical protein